MGGGYRVSQDEQKRSLNIFIQTFTLRADGAFDDDLIPFMRLVCIKNFDAFLLESVFRQVSKFAASSAHLT
eukprot:768818-Hanusia_phi.AAC.2